MIKFIHAADLHLDSAFAALEPERARQRRQEARELPKRLAQLALAEKADLVLLSGDLFDGAQVYPETMEQLRAALEQMACPVFIAPGNHDPCTVTSPYMAEPWPDNVHIFRSGEMSQVYIEELGCVVHGAAFTGGDREDEVLAGFSVPVDDRLHIICLHGNVTAAEGRYGPIRKEQIALCGADYLALGHVHQFSGLNKQGVTCWAYPGCPEGRGFDELGDKGVLVGTIRKKEVQARFVPLAARRYRLLRVDVTDCPPAQALESAVTAEMETDICRVVFIGEAGETGVDLKALAAEFSRRFYALQLRDETTPSRDLWDRAGEDSLRGLFLQKLRRQYDAAREPDREKILRAVRFGLAAMDGRDLG